MRWFMALLLSVFLVGVVNTSGPNAKLGDQMADRILVDKSDRLLWLYAGDVEIARYSIALGGNPIGDKQQEGDKRTPEGRYVIDWRNPKSAFYRSLHISYPDRSDLFEATRRRVSAGGDIFIHGSPNWWPLDNMGLVGDWTLGCIAVTNTEMDQIWALVPDGTPIEIRP